LFKRAKFRNGPNNRKFQSKSKDDENELLEEEQGPTLRKKLAKKKLNKERVKLEFQCSFEGCRKWFRLEMSRDAHFKQVHEGNCNLNIIAYLKGLIFIYLFRN
jgi:hypothetical protein